MWDEPVIRDSHGKMLNPYDPLYAAEWLIWKVTEEAIADGTPLNDDELRLLRTDVRKLVPGDRRTDQVIALNNRVVWLARRRMEREKAAGAHCTKARRGLRIPTSWATHYDTTWHGNQSWLISAIIQNAMLSNPTAGENKPWKSR